MKKEIKEISFSELSINSEQELTNDVLKHE